MKLFEKLNRRVTEMLTGNAFIAEGVHAPAPEAPLPDPEEDNKPKASSRFNGPWPLDRPLLHFSTVNKRNQRDKIPFSLDDSYQGTFIFGGVGSGKTSGSGRAFAASFLRAGFGGLVCCVKADEAATWVRYAEENGRADDVIVFRAETLIEDPKGEKDENGAIKKQPCGFNFLAYELEHADGNPAEAATNVLMEIVGSKGGGDSKNKMWELASRRLLRCCLEACQLAGEEPSLAKMYKIATNKKYADEMLAKATARKDAVPPTLDESQVEDLEGVKSFFNSEWVNMAAETQGSILLNMTGVCDPFASGALRNLFTRGTTVSPEDVFKGKVVVIDLPTLRNYEAGKAAQIAWKYCVQRAVLRRVVTDKDRPVFIYADECQAVITEQDGEFCTVSRSHRCATVMLTQNRPNLLIRMSKERVDAMLGCFQAKCWHQNGDPETDAWASDVIAKDYQSRASTSANYNNDRSQQQDKGGGSTSYQQSLEHQVLPGEFLKLGKGGKPFGYVVTAILFQSGRIYETTKLNPKDPKEEGKSFAAIAFDQLAPVPL